MAEFVSPDIADIAGVKFPVPVTRVPSVAPAWPPRAGWLDRPLQSAVAPTALHTPQVGFSVATDAPKPDPAVLLPPKRSARSLLASVSRPIRSAGRLLHRAGRRERTSNLCRPVLDGASCIHTRPPTRLRRCNEARAGGRTDHRSANPATALVLRAPQIR